MAYKSYSHSKYSSKNHGYSKTHVSGVGSESQGNGYHYSSYYTITKTTQKACAHVKRTETHYGNTVVRTTSGNDGKGNSFFYKGTYKKHYKK